jgi:hypothetical protein
LNACRFFPTTRNKQAWELHKQVRKLILEIVNESGEDKNLFFIAQAAARWASLRQKTL